jgi:uncharacterized membrane protein
MAGFFRNKHHEVDPVWHAQIAMLCAIGLQFALPDKFSAGSRYALPAVELLLLIALSITTPKQPVFRSIARRVNAILLIAIATAANIYSLSQVADALLQGKSASTNGKELIVVAINIYLTNIIILGLWYWEMDGGGPGQRHRTDEHYRDFLFPQNQNEQRFPKWKPTFIDYLYVSGTNAMAFSPTDTMPLSRRAKLLMFMQATVSLIAIALVAARAVNILG